MEIQDHEKVSYKVTRRLAEMTVADNYIYISEISKDKILFCIYCLGNLLASSERCSSSITIRLSDQFISLEETLTLLYNSADLV